MRRDIQRMLDALKEGAYFVDRERRITYWTDNPILWTIRVKPVCDIAGLTDVAVIISDRP